MIGTWRVRSLPRMNSASSKPSMPGIWTSSSARATSWTRSSSSASSPDRAFRSTSPSRRSSASSDTRLSSRSSTRRKCTELMWLPVSCWTFLLLVDPLPGYEFPESLGLARKTKAFLGAQAEEALACKGVAEKRKRPVLQAAIEIDQYISAGDQVHLAE